MSARWSSWIRSRDPDEARCATVAVARDPCGIVLLASPDGQRFRTVDRLTMTAAEAETLYEESVAPMLSVQDLQHLYGAQVANLQLARV